MRNRANQALVFPHFQLFLTHVTLHVGIEETIMNTMTRNAILASKVDAAFIRQCIKLLIAETSTKIKIRWIKILREMMNDKMDPATLFLNQVTIIQNIERKYDKIATTWKDQKTKM